MEPRFFDLKRHSKASGYKTFIHVGSDIVDLHTHDYYEVFLTETDKIVHVINGVEEVLQEGSLIFVRPWDVHQIRHDNIVSFCYINFNFSAEIFEKLMDYLGNETLRRNLLEPKNSPIVRLTEPERKRLYEQICRIGQLQDTDEKQGRHDGAMYMRRTLLDIFITYFADEQKEKRDEMPDWLRYTLRQMEKHANFSQGITRMEEISGRSLRHIARSMQKYKGMKPTEYINELRIQYAASMLIHSNLNILDIALESGFQSEAYFYQLFLKQMGTSPKQYREMNKK